MSEIVETRMPTLAWTNINSGAGTIIQKGVGILHSLNIVNAGTAWEIDVFDGTTSAGTRIAAIRSAAASANYTLDVPFTTGLFIDTVKGTTVGELLVTII